MKISAMTAKRIVLLVLLLFPTASEAQIRETVQNILDHNLGGVQRPSDFVIEGVLTSSRGTEQPFRALIKGNMSRYETGFGENSLVSVFGADENWTAADGTRKGLQPRTGARRPVLIPSLDLLDEIRNPRLQLTDSDFIDLGNLLTRRIILALADEEPERRPFGRALDETVILYVEPTTSLIVRTERIRHAEDNIDMEIPSVLDFSDYREVEGIWIPFRIVNTLGSERLGHRQSTLTISNVTINQGIADAMFVIE